MARAMDKAGEICASVHASSCVSNLVHPCMHTCMHACKHTCTYTCVRRTYMVCVYNIYIYISIHILALHE